MAGKIRQDRVAAQIQREIGHILMRKVKDPRVRSCTVTHVEVSSDLAFANLKISVVGTDQEKKSAMHGLDRAAGFIRRELGKVIDLRNTPELRFYLDHSVDDLMKIDQIIKNAAPQNGN